MADGCHHQIVARLRRTSHRLIEFGNPFPVILIRLVFDTLADCIHLVALIRPVKAIADEAEHGINGLRLDTDDHQAREQSSFNCQPDHRRIEMAERRPPFLCQRAQRIVLIAEQRREVSRFDNETPVHRRYKRRSTKLRQSCHGPLARGGDLGTPFGREIDQAVEVSLAGLELLLNREQRRERHVARMEVDLDDLVMQGLQTDEAEVFYSEDKWVVIRIHVTQGGEEFRRADLDPLPIQSDESMISWHRATCGTWFQALPLTLSVDYGERLVKNCLKHALK